jgi:rhodanese-related sulfurtransferase
MIRTLLQAVLIVMIGAALGVLANTVGPRRIAWITPPKPVAKPESMLGLEKAKQFWDSGAQFVDARAREDFEAGHIENALSLPANEFQEHWPKVAPLLSPETQLVVYCDGLECDLSHELEAKLKQFGFQNVVILTNGWTLWSKAGFPIRKGVEQ